MIENRFDILVDRYLVDELNANEFAELEGLVNSNEYYQLKFKESVKINALLDEATSTVDSDAAFNEFLTKIEKPKKVFKLRTVLRYAAVFVGVLLSVYGVSLINSSMNSDPRLALVVPNEDIMLYEENGEAEKIEFSSNTEITDDSQFNELKVGEGKFYGVSQFKAPVKFTNYTLKIPFGKKISVILSDGTKVFLNSGSTLTYPNSFENAKNRVVKLQGEGYFEVTKNKRKPFIVKTDMLDVRVLGTKFNVSAYKNDGTNSVTLVEGKVAVSKPKELENSSSKTLFLDPNEKATIKAKSKKLSKKVVTDIDKDVSWKNKEFVFKNDKFINISKKLERNFNVKIVSENKKFNNKEFTGKFTKQDVFEILDAFRVHTPFTYKVEGNSIILKK